MFIYTKLTTATCSKMPTNPSMPRGPTTKVAKNINVYLTFKIYTFFSANTPNRETPVTPKKIESDTGRLALPVNAFL